MTERTVFQSMAQRHVISVLPSASAYTAACVMTRTNSSSVLVIDAANSMLGIVTERDMITRVLAKGQDPNHTLVADIMTRSVITVTPDTGTLACMSLMSQHKIRHLPVLQGAQVLGMISIRDLMNDIIADHEQTISQLTNYIKT